MDLGIPKFLCRLYFIISEKKIHPNKKWIKKICFSDHTADGIKVAIRLATKAIFEYPRPVAAPETPEPVRCITSFKYPEVSAFWISTLWEVQAIF